MAQPFATSAGMQQPFASSFLPPNLRPHPVAASRGYIGTQLPPLSSRMSSPRKSRNRPFGQTGTWGQMGAYRDSRFRAATAQSLGSSSSPKPFKNEMLKHIDGELAGSPPMVGVTTMSFSRNQHLYLDDFKEVNANKIMHPYLTMVGDSSPHNLITGTAFAPVSRGSNSLWMSEASRQYQEKSYLNTIGGCAGGLRCEQLVFDAKYVN